MRKNRIIIILSATAVVAVILLGIVISFNQQNSSQGAVPSGTMAHTSSTPLVTDSLTPLSATSIISNQTTQTAIKSSQTTPTTSPIPPSSTRTIFTPSSYLGFGLAKIIVNQSISTPYEAHFLNLTRFNGTDSEGALRVEVWTNKTAYSEADNVTIFARTFYLDGGSAPPNNLTMYYTAYAFSGFDDRRNCIQKGEDCIDPAVSVGLMRYDANAGAWVATFKISAVKPWWSIKQDPPKILLTGDYLILVTAHIPSISFQEFKKDQ